MLRGAEELVSHCEKKWGIRCGETTDDRKYTVAEEECLGSCGTAPVMMMNEEYYENLDPEKFDRIVDNLE